MNDLRATEIATLDGTPTTLGDLMGDRLCLIVNVASRCGLTPQYGQLEALHTELAARGFAVIGVPCNQFGGQEPGTADEIAEFCSATYGVTFPMTTKVDVNGAGRHPVYDVLTAATDGDGTGGDVQWNFEKFLVTSDGTVVDRFRPQVTPADPTLRDAIEGRLA